jgi:hypothetical protein
MMIPGRQDAAQVHGHPATRTTSTMGRGIGRLCRRSNRPLALSGGPRLEGWKAAPPAKARVRVNCCLDQPQAPDPSPDGQDVKHFAGPRQPGASGRLRTRPLNGHSLSRLAVLKHERLPASAGTVSPAAPIRYRPQGLAAPAPHLPAPCTATACQAHNASRMLTPWDRMWIHSPDPPRLGLESRAPYFKGIASPVVDSSIAFSDTPLSTS